MNKDFWEKNAVIWGKAIQDQLIESRKTTNPAIIQKIIQQKPANVLDLGCGEGWIASQLPEEIKYTGLDFSPTLIEIAHQSYPKAVFESFSYEDLIANCWSNVGKFDTIVFNFSLFDENIQPILRKAVSFLNPNGKILIQTLHPSFALSPYKDGWKTEDFQKFPVPFDGSIPWYGRTLETWVRTCTESGLVIHELAEPLNLTTQIPISLILVLKCEG